MARVKVLIAAATAADADNLATRAEAAGYQVKARAVSGKAAVALAGTGHSDLVLMDTHVGGKRGIPAVVRKIQALCNMPVVLVADSDEDIPAVHRSTAVPYGFLVRPFGTRQFRQVIDAAVYRYSLERETGENVGDKKTYTGPSVRKIAHDINNSLSSALANIQIARRSSSDEDSLREHLDGAEESVLRARDHSHQLLTLSGGPEKDAGAQRRGQVPAAHSRRNSVQKKGNGFVYKILLMDDEEAILSATSDMLSFLGHNVTVAGNGEEAIELYKKAQDHAMPFDAVILDITVPGGLGAQETLPRLRALDPNVRAIISSGYTTHPLLIGFADQGFVAALIKPYGFKELEESLAQVFRS